MQKRTVFLAAALALCGLPAMASDFNVRKSEPKPITAFAVGGYEFQMLAVTRRARADTALRREHIEEAVKMGKVMPGYPQPAFVSLDIRFKF
jgi:hypothetical protein